MSSLPGYAGFIWIIALFLSGLVPGLRAEVEIERTTPEQVFVEAGGNPGKCLLDGTGLSQIERVLAYRNGRETTDLLIRIGGESDRRRQVVTLAQPGALRGGGYQAIGFLKSGLRMRLPVDLVVVEAGDARAVANTPGTRSAREMAAEGTETTLIVEREQAPIVEATQPEPLRVPPTGESFTFRLGGTNLNQITDVRVRPAEDPPRYRKNQGKLPFRQTEFGIELEVMASSSANPGDAYKLDLMVERYLAVTLDFEVGQPDEQAPEPVQSRRVIELPAIAPLD